MRIGWYISGAGHLALILLLIFGGLFSRDRMAEVAISEVTVISEAEFAALSRPASAPETETEAPAQTAPAEDTAPEAPAADAAPSLPEPQPVEVPEAPETPDIEVPEQPVPEAVIIEDAPEIEMPETDIDGTSLERDVVAAPAPRVAPVPQVAPPPEAETAPEPVEARAPEPDPEPQPEPEPEEEKPAAPEQASDRIVTEAEETKELAPASSKRPKSRPAQPVRAAETPKNPKPETPSETPRDPAADAVAAAVAEAAKPAPAPAAPSGPPLTGGEREALVVSVSSCWNVGSLSTEALATTVVVAVSMQQDGKPVTDSIRLVSSSGGSSGAAQQAFEAARRAIIRCGARGFPLPVEKYGQWRDIEMTFNPEGMQFR